MESTGEILEKYIRRKISQVELSKLIGVSPQYISNIINDLKGGPNTKMVGLLNLLDANELETKLKEVGIG